VMALTALVVPASTVSAQADAPCTIRTVNGHYLTALGGGGHGAEVPETLHSDATKVNSWEKFKLFCQGGGGNPGCLRGAILC
jgi:hypothetical protein